MNKLKVSAVMLSFVLLAGAAPLTVSAPATVSAAPAAATAKYVKAQSMDVKMIFDGVSLAPPKGQYVFIHKDTTYVPVRFMSYALKKSVSWDAKNVKVTVAEPNSTELVVIKEYLMNNSGTGKAEAGKTISLLPIEAKYAFDGSEKAVPTGLTSYMLNGSLYVPLRFLSEAVGSEIKWDQKTKTITASSPEYTKAQAESGNGLGNTAEGNSNAGSGSASSEGAAGGEATPGGGGAAPGGDSSAYGQITSEAQSKLESLKNQSQGTLLGIAMEYKAANDANAKAAIKARGIQQLESFKSSFNSIIAETEQKLKAGGHDTSIIDQYRAEFQKQLAIGEAMAEAMAGN